MDLSWILGIAIGDPLTLSELQTLVRFILLLGIVFAAFVFWRLKAIVIGVNKSDDKIVKVSESTQYNRGQVDTILSLSKKKG